MGTFWAIFIILCAAGYALSRWKDKRDYEKLKRDASKWRDKPND